MESSRNLSKIFNILLPFSDFLYILQQEEYSTKRYFKWLSRFFWRRNFQVRDQLKYTKRATAVLFAAVAVWLISLIFGMAVFRFRILPELVIIFLWLVLIPVFVPLANVLLVPLSNLLKIPVIRRATARIKQQKGLHIIAVAGSFGKTTTKNFIEQLARYNYPAQLIPGNINTTLGIANWINSSLKPSTKLLIVEMDAYRAGEIRQSCAISPPDIAILTNIGDQHLERFGNREKLARALKEIFLYAKPDAKLLCTKETASTINFQHQASQEMIIVEPDTLVLPKIIKESIVSRFSISNRLNLSFAVKTAELLNIPQKFIIDTLPKLEIPARRQKITGFSDYDCIDDSYNISFTTAQAGLDFAKEFARQKRKKLLVITAGIPELAPVDRDKNEVFGKILAEKADYVAVLKSIFWKDIVKGLASPRKYAVFTSLKSFMNETKQKFPSEGWVILLQPELTDLYY